MKKTIVELFVACAFGLTASAVPSISLTTGSNNGVFKNNSDFSEANYCGSGLTVLMVWSQDSTWATPVQGSIPSSAGAFGSDYVLYAGFGDAAYGIGSDLDGNALYTSATIGSADPNLITGGYVYLMMFNTTSASPLAGTQYIVSPMAFPLSDAMASQTPPPDVVDLAPADPAYFGQPLGGTVAAVPEPSTVGLLLVGASLVALRRFRKAA